MLILLRNSILLLVLGVIMSTSVLGQESTCSFSRVYFESVNSGSPNDLQQLKQQYWEDENKFYLIERAYAIFHKNRDSIVDFETTRNLSLEEKAVFLSQNIMIYEASENHLMAMESIHDLENYEILMTPFQKGQLLLIKGNVYASWGDYSLSLENLQRAQSYFLRASSTISFLRTQFQIIDINANQGMFGVVEQRINFMNENYGDSIKKYTYMNIAMNFAKSWMYLAEDDFDKAVIGFKKIILEYEEQNDLINARNTKLDLALIHTYRGNLDSAYYYYEDAYKMPAIFHNEKEKLEYLIWTLSAAYDGPRSTELVNLFGFSTIDEIFVSIESLLTSCDDQQYHLDYLIQKKRYYEYLQSTDKLIDVMQEQIDLFVEMSVNDTAKYANINYKLKLTEQENKRILLEKENALRLQSNTELKLQKKEQLNFVLIISFILVMILLVALFFTSRKVRIERHAKQMNRLKIEQTKKDLNLKEHLLQELKREFEERGNIIESIKKDLITKNDERISELGKIKILTKTDWKRFRDLFALVHPNLMDKLTSTDIELSSGEQRMIMLYKLDFSQEHIANITGISPESVRKSIYRLRKKLEPISLIEFVITEQDS